jgi:replicative DNA helicase
VAVRSAPRPSTVCTGSETIEWSEKRLALLGQLIGDGSYLVSKPLRYTSSSAENRDVVARAAIDEFSAIVYPQKPIGSWQQLYIGGNGNRWHPAGVNGWLRALGIFGQCSDQKRLPREVFRLPNRQLVILLQHLWATDGCISVSKPARHGGHSVYYATNSIGLAGDVAALMLRFGIVTRTYKVEQEGYVPGYQVNVSGTEAQQRFLEQIGAFGPRVEPADALAEAIIGVEPNTNVDTVPREVFAFVKARMREKSITQRAMAALRGTSYGGNAHFKFSPSRATVIEYAALLDDDELFAHASSDLFWDSVIEVAPDGEEEVFDLTVPGPASWLADGIVSHNSGAIEQDSDVVLMLWRDKEDTAAGAPKLIHGSIAKNRNGPTGIFSLLFAAEQAKFFSKTSDDVPV